MRGTHRHNDWDSPEGRISKRSDLLTLDASDYSEEEVDGRDTDSQQERHNSRKFHGSKGHDRSERGRRPRKKTEEDVAGGDPAESGENVKEKSKVATHGRRHSNSVSKYSEEKEERHRSATKSARTSSSSSEDSEDSEDTHDNESTRRRDVREREKHDRLSVRRGTKRKHRVDRAKRRRDDSTDSYTTSTSSSEVSDSEDSVRREKERQHYKKRKRKERERRLEKEAKRKLRKKMKESKKKDRKVELKKKQEMRSKQPITTSWGKYGILKDIDMWNKKPEFSAWLAEVKKVNMETLPNWEEKEMFKEYMEDYNTATFPSKKYYNMDVYHRRKATKARMKGMAKLAKTERTDFNDEDERRVELLREREKRKESEVQALLRKMQSGMAQDMKEQAQLREEMQYQFRLGNREAAQALQRRLDPDADKFVK